MFYNALLFGLLGSFHCIGMCAPIAFMLPVSRDNTLKKVFQIFLYHSGRLLAYSSIGLAFGMVGKSLKRIKYSLGAAFKKRAADTFFTIGFLNGFLPCGLVYMAVFGAVATGDMFQGSIYMLLFGIGTIPLMTTAVFFSSLLTPSLRLGIRRIIPAFVVIIGLLFILRGLGRGIPYISPAPVQNLVIAEASCH